MMTPMISTSPALRGPRAMPPNATAAATKAGVRGAAVPGGPGATGQNQPMAISISAEMGATGVTRRARTVPEANAEKLLMKKNAAKQPAKRHHKRMLRNRKQRPGKIESAAVKRGWPEETDMIQRKSPGNRVPINRQSPRRRR